MTVLDPGHHFSLDIYDDRSGSGRPQQLLFMKRDSVSHPGGYYPGNKGSHAGTNIQEVLRALISRVKYLNGQIETDENYEILFHLRAALRLLEKRAAKRRGYKLSKKAIEEIYRIDQVPTCKQCGHIECRKHDAG